MKKCLVLATVLALGVTAFTPTAAVADPPTLRISCQLADGSIKILKTSTGKGGKLGDAFRECNRLGGHPVRVERT